MSTLYTEAMKRSELVSYLDAYLEVASFEGIDRSLNSLVVGPSEREVHTVAFAVDACQATFEKAMEEHADLLVVHHGGKSRYRLFPPNDDEIIIPIVDI